MKRLYFLAIFLSLPLASMADEVTMEEAAQVAANALCSDNVEYVWNGLGEEKFGAVDPAFYVFEGNGQWVVVAADDCAVPVLMHGEGGFDPDDIPDNMRSVLKGIEANILQAREHGVSQAPDIRQSWVEAKSGRRDPARPGMHAAAAVTKLVGNGKGTARWNQGVPYYNQCPTFESEPCYAGCVAASMTILMRHFQWPSAGRGVIPAYTTRSKKIAIPAIDIDGFQYDWASLPLTDARRNTAGDWDQDLIDLVGTIMFHCGAMVAMDYTPTGSGAFTPDALAAMAKYMSYSADARELFRSSYTNQEWLSMIKAEIDADHPLIYGGYDSKKGSGHQYVCDGYNSDNEIHINWGWGGSYNGWFAVCYLGPVGGTGIDYVFSYQDSAIFGLVPDKSGSEPANECPDLLVSTSYPGGISLSGGEIAKGSDFSLAMSSIWNSSSHGYDGSMRAALLSKNGVVKEFISDEAELSLSAGQVVSALTFDCSISGSITLGDYISIMYCLPDESWTPVGKYYNDSKGSVIRLNAVDITLIDSPSSFTAGQKFYPSLILGHKATSSVTWYIDGEISTAGYITLTEGSHTFKVAVTYKDGSTETISKTVTVE